MTTPHAPRILLASLAAVVLLSACSGDGCTNNQNSIPMAGFYDYVSREPISISGLAVSGVGAPNDSLLLEPSTSAHQVYLPFRGAESSTEFYFALGEFADVVTFNYEAYPYFAGEECGAMWRYRITSVEHAGFIIDSIAVTDSLITNIERERIMIFISPATDSDDDSGDEHDDEPDEQ